MFLPMLSFSMQKEEFDQQIETIIDYLEDDVVAKRRVQTTWPLIIYPLPKMTSHGARFQAIPAFSTYTSHYVTK